jgi:hypothetical protein
MTRRIIILASVLVALGAGGIVVRALGGPSVTARPVQLIITGPQGQRFSGSYVADGVTNSLTATAPATIRLQARDLDFTFNREAGAGEFRVELHVGDLCRTSTGIDEQQGIRGQLRYSATSESYWAAGF